MDEELTHEQNVERLMSFGLTRVQAERELAAQAGQDVSDVVGQLGEDAKPS